MCYIRPIIRALLAFGSHDAYALFLLTRLHEDRLFGDFSTRLDAALRNRKAEKIAISL